MITAALDAGVLASWVAGDEVNGADPILRATVRAVGLGYALQVAANRRMPTGAGMRRVDERAVPPRQSGHRQTPLGGVDARG